tara:strand:+ start:254 stop:454 length:201 start_codon:yes stop_codon:yes gene_type:complete
LLVVLAILPLLAWLAWLALLWRLPGLVALMTLTAGLGDLFRHSLTQQQDMPESSAEGPGGAHPGKG